MESTTYQTYKKALVVAGRILLILLAVFALLSSAFAVFAVAVFDKNEGNGFLGYKFNRVLDDSMTGVAEAGDMAVMELVEPSALQVGDIISYKSINPEGYGEVLIREILETTTYDGKPAFLTGTRKDGAVESYPALEERVIGRFRFALPRAGTLADFIKSPGGYFLLILLPYLLILLPLGARIALLRLRYRQEAQLETTGGSPNAQTVNEPARAEEVSDQQSTGSPEEPHDQ